MRSEHSSVSGYVRSCLRRGCVVRELGLLQMVDQRRERDSPAPPVRLPERASRVEKIVTLRRRNFPQAGAKMPLAPTARGFASLAVLAGCLTEGIGRDTVHAQTAMTVKEMGPARKRAGRSSQGKVQRALEQGVGGRAHRPRDADRGLYLRPNSKLHAAAAAIVSGRRCGLGQHSVQHISLPRGAVFRQHARA